MDKTRILKIGKSESSLRQEILNHFDAIGTSVTVVFATIGNEKTTETEKKLLRDFEDKHWDLPVLNSHRGYERGEDRHYRRLPHQA
jgi:hypothetical protein